MILVVEPVFAERLWGGTALRDYYGAKVPDGIIGESWAVSGLAGSAGAISHGAPEGATLQSAWASGLITGQPRHDEFPLLCKFLDPQDWLSVQVHPNDEQAMALEGKPRGKAECWYILEALPAAMLILGHHRQTAEQLRQDLLDGVLLEQLILHEAHPGFFFNVPAGTIHAAGPGMLIYEVQQSSDITYRLYDYDRIGLEGKPRDLHVDQGFAVVSAPSDLTHALTADMPVRLGPGVVRRELVSNEYFRVRHWSVEGSCEIASGDYWIATVVSGSGVLTCGDDVVPAPLATSVVVPADCGPVGVEGTLELIVTEPGRRV